MKMIVAIIEPHKLTDVKKALYDVQVFNMTVTNALGCSKQKGYKQTYRGVEQEMFLFKKIRLEIGVNEDFVEPTIEAICRAAKMDIDRNHGVIFVFDLVDCIRVTGERGPQAIG